MPLLPLGLAVLPVLLSGAFDVAATMLVDPAVSCSGDEGPLTAAALPFDFFAMAWRATAAILMQHARVL